MYSHYILQCSDKTLYTGICVDLKKRVGEHNYSPRGAKYTRSRRPVKLVYTKKFRTRSNALKAEIMIKKLARLEKLTFIKKSKKSGEFVDRTKKFLKQYEPALKALAKNKHFISLD